LLGPSGSGKSTILRIIAGIEAPEAGQVLWDGQEINPIPAYRRQFGLMFQDYALFPHRNVAENVAFGLRMHNLPKEEIDRRVREALERVNMTSFAKRSVIDLSGGEQQRVALARALAPGPRLLMLDEPLAALDRTLRERLTEELRLILHKTGIPAIYVTHDQEEAFAIADRLILIQEGQIVQSGAPAEVYQHPSSPWVARFFGLDNLLAGEILETDPLTAQTSAGQFTPGFWTSTPKPGQAGWILLRPGGGQASRGQEINCIEGRVEDAFFQGSAFEVRIQLPQGGLLSFLLDAPPLVGNTLRLALNPKNILWLVDAHE
jgi:ABC-type Fe3+/spermidine/putrescine transport system ATPase subunit